MSKILIDRDLLEQALEALEHHVEQTRPIYKTTMAIEALIAALEQPQVEQEPAIYPEEAFDMGLEAIPYYTHPQPPRQPLTEEEIRDLFQDQRAFPRLLKFIRAIEAVHGIGEPQ